MAWRALQLRDKKLPLHLKKKVLSPSSRFNITVSDSEIEKSSKGYIPKNTSRSTSWAVRVFTQWIEQRNKHMEITYPLDLLEKAYGHSIICECLQRFVSEARRADGTNYPPKTIYQILCGLLRYSRENHSDPINFLDRKDTRFKKLHATCDVIFRTLHEEGIGVERKSTPVVTKANEDKLWETGVLNTSTPTGLQRAVFYYIGKVCCIRGGEEQRNLKPSQFKCYTSPDKYIYSEHGSKNHNGGFFQLDVENKTVSIFRNEEAGERCLVLLLDMYLKRLPEGAIQKDWFYCKPLDNFRKDKDGPWYCVQPRGKHFLNNMVKSMFSEANIAGDFTNHSLRATGATELFQSETPEKVIQDITGHRSVSTLHQYERVGDVQKKAACNILTGATAQSYPKEIEMVNNTEKNNELQQQISMEQSTLTSAIPFQLSGFSPVVNSNSTGTVNFVVNICPTGNIDIKNSTEVKSQSNDYDSLLEGIDMDDLFSDI